MSQNETYVTVQGWVGNDPDFKEFGGGSHRTRFRVGSTPRQYEAALGTWVDKTATWFNVECWRTLAQNTFESVRIGQPIIITGKLRTHEWTDEAGERHSRVVLEAFSVGHDLTRGITTFTKNPPRAATSDDALKSIPSSGPAEVSASPYPADAYSVASLPLTTDDQVPDSAAA